MQAELAQLTLYLLFGTVWFLLLAGSAAFLSILRQLRLSRFENQVQPQVASVNKRATAAHPALRVTSDRLSMQIQPDEPAIVEKKVG